MPFLNDFWKSYKCELLCLLLFFIVWTAFIQAIGCGFINYDDQDYVTHNSHIISGLSVSNIIWAFSSTTSANWAPITMVSHMLDCQMFGLRPWGHHLISITLHCFSVVILFLLLFDLTHAVWRSFWATLIWGIHPLRVESVVWISERKDVLCTLFFLLSLLSYSKYTRQADAIDKSRYRTYYGLSLLCFLIGLLSKSMAVTLPCVLLLMDFWPLNRWNRRAVLSVLKEKAPFALFGILFSIVTLFTQSQAEPPLTHLPVSHRLVNVFISCSRYVGKLICPIHLSIFYPYPLHYPFSEIILCALSFVLVSVLVIALSRHCYLLFGWLWFLLTLLPVSGLVQVGTQSMADRYSYIPSIGLVIIVVWSCQAIAARSRSLSRYICVVAIASVVVLTAMTRRQIHYWNNGVTIWEHAVAVTDNNYIGYSLLGFHDLEMDRYGDAINKFNNVIRIMSPITVKERIGLGFAFIHEGKSHEAIEPLRVALRIQPNNLYARTFLGVALIQDQQISEGVSDLVEVLKNAPKFSLAQKEMLDFTNGCPDLTNNFFQYVPEGL